MPGLLNDQEYAAQLQAGKGVTSRYGPKPPTADEVAERGTPEWRAAWKRMEDWRNNQFRAGATAFDMGFRDKKELGKHLFTRMRMGDVDPRARGDWVQANEGWGRGSYNPNDTNFYGQQGRIGPGKLKQQQDQEVPEGEVDMWPGAGQQGFLPKYSNPQYNPVDSWGGWSGVYGSGGYPGMPTPEQANIQSNPAGLSGNPLMPPASFQPNNSLSGQPVGIGPNLGKRPGGSFGGTTRIGPQIGRPGIGGPIGIGKPMNPAGMLIRR